MAQDSSLGDDAKVCGFEVADYNEDLIGSVSYIGAHRSKGMDFLAVIIIDFAPFEELSADPKYVDVQEAYFMAVISLGSSPEIIFSNSSAASGLFLPSGPLADR